jgi:hypothetical protein
MPGDINRPSWMLLSLLSGGRELTAGRRCELRVDGEVFTVSGSEREIAVEAGADRDPQATVTITMEDLTGLMTGRRTRKAARSRAQVDGDETAALELLAALEGALAPAGALSESRPVPVPAARPWSGPFCRATWRCAGSLAVAWRWGSMGQSDGDSAVRKSGHGRGRAHRCVHVASLGAPAVPVLVHAFEARRIRRRSGSVRGWSWSCDVPPGA